MRIKSGKAALLWDESFLWGLMALRALRANGLPFDLLRAEDIKRGIPGGYRLLFVPGGWASNKIKALGDEGTSAIRAFVENGGSYLGFCGGAGLATLDGIGLLNVKRRPTRDRVPSFSGRIGLNLAPQDHPVWSGIGHSVFHAWWPSQFVIDDTVKVLATYGGALPDSFSSDLNVGDTVRNGGWAEMESIYRINLDPGRLRDEPAIVEGECGSGKVVLSLVHFDTPGDANGSAVLRNLWEYLAGHSAATEKECRPAALSHCRTNKASALISELETAVDELISLGTRNFLWFRRNPMLIQWRRGIRGLEYCTLHVMIKEIAAILSLAPNASVESGLEKIKELLLPFTDKARRLLVLERLALQTDHITYEQCDDPEIKGIRTELFANSKSYGGAFKELLDEIDKLLYTLLKLRR